MKKKVNKKLRVFSGKFVASRTVTILSISFLIISISLFGIILNGQKQVKLSNLSDKGLVKVSAESNNLCSLDDLHLNVSNFFLEHAGLNDDNDTVPSKTELPITAKMVSYVPRGGRVYMTITAKGENIPNIREYEVKYQYKSPSSNKYSDPTGWFGSKDTTLPKDREIGLWRNRVYLVNKNGNVLCESYSGYKVVSEICPQGGIHIQYAKGRNADAPNLAWYPALDGQVKTEKPQVKSNEFLVTRIVDGSGKMIDLEKYAILYRFGRTDIKDLGESQDTWDSDNWKIWNKTMSNPKSAKPPINKTGLNVFRTTAIELLGNESCNARSEYIVLPN